MVKVKMKKNVITLTFGDVCENHAGMQKIGSLQKNGFTKAQLAELHEKYKNDSELIQLEHDDAVVLVFRDGLNSVLKIDKNDVYKEQNDLIPDKKAFMRGRVVNKIARYNLCFSDKGQEANFEEKKGTIIPFHEVPLTSLIKDFFENLFQIKLQCEGNYYYDISSKKVGIGYHGDTERRIVIGVRLSESEDDFIGLKFRKFIDHKPISDGIKLNLFHGDIYIMSEKASGFDWRSSTKETIRHCAGNDDFIKKEDKRVS